MREEEEEGEAGKGRAEKDGRHEKREEHGGRRWWKQ